MNIPEQIKVGTITYRVTLDPDEWLRLEHDRMRKGDYGYSDHSKAVIYLNPDSSPLVHPLTLLHEVFHALTESVMGAPDWNKLGKDKHDREETVVRMWEHPVLSVLQDNPDLVAYLTAKR